MAYPKPPTPPFEIPKDASLVFVTKKGVKYWAGAWWGQKEPHHSLRTFHCFAYSWDKELKDWVCDSNIPITTHKREDRKSDRIYIPCPHPVDKDELIHSSITPVGK